MPPNLRKSQPDLSKPSEGGTFSAGRKPSEGTNPLSGLNLRAERELGSVGGVKATAELTVGIDNLIGQQGLSTEIDATNRTAGFKAGIGSTKGKLGVNIGGKVGYDEEGKLSIKGAEAGINIGGFGGSASIDEDEGIRGSVSIAGAKAEIGISKDGKKTLSLCYGVPGGELCVTFEPDPGIELPTPTPTPTPISRPGVGSLGADVLPLINDNCYYYVLALQHGTPTRLVYAKPLVKVSEHWFYTRGVWTIAPGGDLVSQERIELQLSPSFIEWHDYPTRPDRAGYSINSKNYALLTGGGLQSPAEISGNVAISYAAGVSTYDLSRGTYTKTWINYCINSGGIWEFSVIETSCLSNPPGTPPRALTPVNRSNPSPSPSPINRIQLPNYPQHFKRMNCCCEKVEEIYKYLGIAQFKKNKFPVSEAFLVPGGTGIDNCLNYYAIMQALFRMLANGLIINPKSKPLGTEWQNVNATAWASAMYEMMAESMSDGNSSQRFEVAAIMQLTQMMATLAENGRKIEFVVDAIGIEPMPVAEEVPVCFTIYEGHKGFGKKEPKKINVSGLKTDNDVENTLGKMLNPSKIPIIAWKFKPGQISIKEALRNG